MDFSFARKHAETYFQQVPEKSSSRNVGRCYTVGTTVFRRKDGGTFTEADIAAANKLSYGQTSYVSRGTVGSDEIAVSWECDSGD
jgi:hypothetical protein